MDLLDDIDELGDEREIPLLLEYLDDENVSVVRERIQEILKKFSILEIQNLSGTSNKVNRNGIVQHTSVVADFFGHCDSESKLILMDTLVDIIDHKDADFLKELVKDPDVQISDKAQELLNNWHGQQSAPEGPKSDRACEKSKNEKDSTSGDSTAILKDFDSLLDTLEIGKPRSSTILDIEFEIDFEMDEKERSIHENQQEGYQGPNSKSAFLGFLKSLQTKILEKIYG